MKNSQTPETLLNQVYNSAKLKKTVIILVLAGMLICIIPLLPPVKNAVSSFFGAHLTEGRLRTLLSLPLFGFSVFALALCCLFSRTVATFLEDIKNDWLIIAAATGIGVLLLVSVSVFSYRYGWQWLNSDHSAEMVLGKLLAQENAFVSRNWYYSTEIRLIYQTLFTMPLFKILGGTGNWALIRSLNIFFNNLTLIFSYFFLLRQTGIRTKWIFISALFLIVPLSAEYWDIVIFGGYYIFLIAQIFCCLGLFIRLAHHNGTVKTALPGFILFTALSFAFGVQGIRSLLCVHIPLLVTCICLHSISMTAQKNKFPLFLGFYGFVVCCAGFAFNFLLHFWYNFHSFQGMLLVDLYAEFFPKLGQSLASLAGFFGFSAGNFLLSAQGLFSLVAIAGTFFLFWAVFKSFRQAGVQDNTTEPAGHQFVPAFFAVSVVFNIFVFVIVRGSITGRYFIPFMVLYIPLTAILFEHMGKRFGHLKSVALVAGIVLFIFGQGYLNFQSMAGHDVNTTRKGYIQYLLDNNLDYGFATFWNANVTTELTDGKIELAGLEPHGLESDTNTSFRIQGWLNPVRYFNPSFYQGESFLLLTRTEWELAREMGLPLSLLQPDYEDDVYIVKRYPSAEIIHREILDN
jgi:hypothetical protein